MSARMGTVVAFALVAFLLATVAYLVFHAGVGRQATLTPDAGERSASSLSLREDSSMGSSRGTRITREGVSSVRDEEADESDEHARVQEPENAAVVDALAEDYLSRADDLRPLEDLDVDTLLRTKNEGLSLVSQLTEAAFEDRLERGLFDTRILPSPVGARDIRKMYGTTDAVSFVCSDPYPDGPVEVQIVRYPRSEYPDLYAIRDLVSELDLAHHAKQRGR